MTDQPSNIEPYIQAENPVTRDPLEQKAAAQPHRQAGSSSEGELGTVGGASQHGQEGVPTSRGYGVHGSGPVDAQEEAATSYSSSTRGARGEKQVLQNENVNADEQLATLAEGKVADAVDRKSGTQRAPGAGPAEEQDFASDLDR
ncbi:hypothetical protein M406DRAFT_321400 [Cryphonectria parasitica EP155]|uniref:Uncharacterized protein n=1 Tax=Cryphonectria parasitica (strain ATCC 38755 / EP155) TaxID=660469 RepID=A0A9P4Y4P3_CRYP1|nr:uncharacterized protein M406DRAFT_321400 [Cryphonectria parasitica EP155]KAF3766899.1 hypothetical protein M406DRAFT_321400 [Cryphonectria parasitica EP155]